MTFVQAMLLALLQGASELFPISSLGHTVIVPALLHWNIDRSDPSFLAFVVALHLGTAIALLIFYRREWGPIAVALTASIARGRMTGSAPERIGWLLIAGTIPVAVLGVFFERPVRALFSSTAIVGAFLILNAAIMFAGEWLKSREKAERPLAELPIPRGVAVGTAQALALLPGISRSGSSMVAGLLAGLDHEDAARFSFLLATPAIGAASLLELPKLFAPDARAMLLPSLAGAVLAGITAYLSVAFLTRYFRSNDLRPFGWYCLLVGALAVVLAVTKRIV
jgi:undecaprenyl-diphosphatase